MAKQITDVNGIVMNGSASSSSISSSSSDTDTRSPIVLRQRSPADHSLGLQV
jgi:hypothetical protein